VITGCVTGSDDLAGWAAVAALRPASSDLGHPTKKDASAGRVWQHLDQTGEAPLGSAAPQDRLSSVAGARAGHSPDPDRNRTGCGLTAEVAEPRFFCRAARSKVFSRWAIRQQVSADVSCPVQIRGRTGPADLSEQGETGVAIQIRGRIRAPAAAGSASRGAARGSDAQGAGPGDEGRSDL